MATRNNSVRLRIAFGIGLLLAVMGTADRQLRAQTPAATAGASASQLGTVKTVSGESITISTDKGQTITVNVAAGTQLLQLPVGSTDLKAAKPALMSDIAVGDRTLVTGKTGDAATINAARVIVMKSGDIKEMQAAEQADWKTRGVGGIVSSVDAAAKTVTISSGTKKITIDTSAKTEFRRFEGDSVKYQDAKPSTFADIQPKDQLQARGDKSADGLTVQAVEVLSGSFLDLSGLIASVDPTAGKITLKDLATKKMVTVNVTANSDVRLMPQRVAATFAARSGGGAQGGGGRRGGGGGGGGAAGAGGYGGGMGGGRSAGADLSQQISTFPPVQLADLKKGDAVMIVALELTPGANTVSAITVLSGVDAILTANPNGGLDLSSWSLGGGGGGGGAE